VTGGRRRLISTLLGLVVSIILMWALFRKIDFVELGEALKGANYFWLLPNIFLIVASLYMRAYRWSFMIQPIKRVDFSTLSAATCIGFMANNVLPLRLGELARAYSLSYQDKEISKSSSLATIFVERMVFDLVALLLIFGVIVSITTVDITEHMRVGIYAAIGVALVGLTFVMWLAIKPDQAGDIISRYLRFLPERAHEMIRGITLKFSRGLEFLRQSKMVAAVGVQTVLIWLVMGLSNYFVFIAFGFDLPLEASFFLLVVVSIAILAPSSPGFVGVYHWGAAYSLMQYGIGQEQAVSFALVLHAAQYIPVTLLGFFYLRKAHLSLTQLEDDAAETVEE